MNPSTGQWYSADRQPISTPPSYAHVQVPVKPKSTNPADYKLPAAVAGLSPFWKYAITPEGKIYYYHVRHRIPQWEPPSPQAQMYDDDKDSDETSADETAAGEESDEEENEKLISMKLY